MVKRLPLLVVVLAVASIAIGVTALPAGAVAPQDTDTTPFGPTWDTEIATNSTPAWAAPPEGALPSDESITSSGSSDGILESTQSATASEPPALNWSQVYGERGQQETFTSVKPTDDGGYVMAGVEPGSEAPNPLIVKTDADGNVEWSETVSYSTVNQIEWGPSITEYDGGYMVSFTSYNNDNEIYGTVATLSEAGDVEDVFRPAGTTQSVVASAHSTSDGAVVTGIIRDGDSNDGWLAKVDGAGSTEWSQQYNNYEYFRPYAVEKTDTGYAIGGAYITNQEEALHPWMATTSEDGELNEGYTDFNEQASEQIQDIAATDDGGFIAKGAYSGENEYGSSLIKLDSDIGQEWKEIYSEDTQSHSGFQFFGSDVAETAEGYGVMGYYYGDGEADTAIFHVGSEGQFEWLEEYGDTDAPDGAFAGEYLGSNSYILGGTLVTDTDDYENDAFAVKVGDAGSGGDDDDGGDGGDGGDGDSSGKTVGLSPATVSASPGSTVTTDVVVRNVSGGVGAYDFDLSANDTTVAAIESFELQGDPGTSTVDISDDGSSASVEAALADTDDTGNVSISSVTFTTTNEGAAAVTLTVNALGDETGQTYDIGTVEDGTISVGAGEDIPAVVGDSPPTDPDGDGEYEDINGDGSPDVVDVQALFSNLDSEAIQNNPAAFDFNNDDSVDVVDVQALFNEI